MSMLTVKKLILLYGMEILAIIVRMVYIYNISVKCNHCFKHLRFALQRFGKL